MELEYKGFLRAYKTVASFSPDNTDFNKDILDSRINKNDFLTELFIDRTAVPRLMEEIFLSPENLLCIAGPRGSGKTSIGLKTKCLLEKDTAFKNFVIPIDIRRDDAIRNVNDSQSSIIYFRNKILNKFKTKFKPNPYLKENDPDLKLICFLLDPDITENKPEIIFNDLIDEISDFIRCKYDYEDENDEIYTYSEFILKYYREIDVKEILNRVRKKITIFHYSFALQSIFEFKRQIVWIDNIDKLSNAEQRILLEGITEIKRGVVDNIVLIVAVREENIYRLEHLEEFAPPKTTPIYWVDPKDNKNAKSYEAFNMPVVNKETLKKIISQRINYARKFQSSQIDKIHEEINNTSDDNKINDFKKKLEILGNKISNNNFERITRLSNRLIEVFIEEKMFFFSNNSLRFLLPLHRNFLSFLIKKHNYKKEIESLKEPIWFLRTELLYYLASNSKYTPFNNYDVVNHCETINYEEKVTCFLPQLILTTIWNYCIKNSRNSETIIHLPTISFVIEKLTFLDFKEESIISEIFKLFFTKNGGTNFISIETSNRISTKDDIELNYKVKVTYKGKITLNNISISFGYFYSLIANKDAQSKQLLSTESFVQYGTKALNQIKNMANNHLKTLLYLRNTKYQEKEKWLEYYYTTYGIPFDPDYSRNKEFIGVKILSNSKYKHSLYLDALLQSFNPFFSNYSTISRTLENITLNYTRILREIENFKINNPDEISI